MGSLFPDWHQAGGLVKDWQIGIGLPFDNGIGQDWNCIQAGGWVGQDQHWIEGFAMDWRIGNGYADQYMGNVLTYL